MIKQTLKLYPYTPGGVGTSIATALEGAVPLAPTPEPPPTTFVEASGLAFNTVPATDFTFYEQLDALVQDEAGDALDPELMAADGRLGIVKGKPLRPRRADAPILTDAAAVGPPRRGPSFPCAEEEGFAYYPDSRWYTPLWVGGTTSRRRRRRSPPRASALPEHWRAHAQRADGVLLPRHRHHAGDDHAADRPRLAVSFAALDGNGNYFDGARPTRVTLPPEIPQGNFWSLTLYDNQTRSLLDTPQRYPRAGSQSYPSPAAEAADGATTVDIGPTRPPEVTEGNWIQTMPDKGWFVILRLYSPLESFFDKTWRPGEVELVP